MNKIFYIALVLCLLLGSCPLPWEDGGGGEEDGPVGLDTVGMDTVGRGYDVFEVYADRDKVKEPILDVEALDAAGLIEKVQIERTTYSQISGNSIDQYSFSLMGEASLSGSYMGFTGSVDSSFEEERYTKDTYSFATYKVNVKKYGLVVRDRTNSESYADYLDDTFLSRLNDSSYSTDALFTTYGTHLMTGVVMGARLDYNVSASTSDLTEGKSIGMYAEASYTSLLASGSGSVSGLTDTEFNQYKSSEQKSLFAYGGSSQYAVTIAQKNDYDAWLATIDDSPVFCDYYDNALVPIWEFCTDEVRRAAIEGAFDQWAADRRINTTATGKLAILDIYVHGDSVDGDSYRSNDEIYYRIYQDLSEGAGGETSKIYAAVGKDVRTDAMAPVTDVITYNTEDQAPPTGYVRAGNDTNKGAGGDYIYVYISRDPAHGDPVRALRTYNQSDGDYNYSRGASGQQSYGEAYNTNGQIQDLNEGAGGDYIFLQFSRDNID